jgi:hypothetical protein
MNKCDSQGSKLAGADSLCTLRTGARQPALASCWAAAGERSQALTVSSLSVKFISLLSIPDSDKDMNKFVAGVNNWGQFVNGRILGSRLKLVINFRDLKKMIAVNELNKNKVRICVHGAMRSPTTKGRLNLTKQILSTVNITFTPTSRKR